MLVDQLYQLSPKSLTGDYAPQLVQASNQLSTAASSHTLQLSDLGIRIDADKLLVLKNFDCGGIGGGGQLVERVDVQVVDSSGTIKSRIRQEVLATPQARFDMQWDGTLLLALNDVLQGTTHYDAGAVANTSRFSISGWIIPRGNFQLA